MLISIAALLAATPCAEGKSVSPDTQGNCCWPGQAWSSARQQCVGLPTSCPAGLAPQGDGCGCPPGQEASPDTQGHCCWPQQAWSGARQLCIGAPRCPANLRASGEACVADGALAPPPAPPPETPPPPPPPPSGPQAEALPPPVVEAPAAPSQVIDGLTVPPGHHVEYRRKMGLLIPGIVLLGAGWLGSLLVAVGGATYSAFVPRNTCWSAAASVGWIPVVGPPLALVRQQDPSLHDEGNHQCTRSPVYPVGAAVGVVLGAMQITGLALMIVGIIVRSPVVVADPQPEAPSAGLDWHLTPGTPGAPLGGSFTLTGW